MLKIFKYDIGQVAAPLMPKGAKILSVGTQENLGRYDRFVWALVDPMQPNVRRDIRLFGTGWDIDAEPGKFIGRITIGPYEWHVFDGGEQ